MKEMARRYRHEWYFFPALGSTGKSLHPLMAWWVVLHALSMLARYQPAEWARYTDVDTSAYAVAVDNCLTLRFKPSRTLFFKQYTRFRAQCAARRELRATEASSFCRLPDRYSGHTPYGTDWRRTLFGMSGR